MTDREFDLLLYQSAAQLPPDEAVTTPPRPWQTPMAFLCWGLALTSVTLYFFSLQHILPPIGGVLLWLGFRMLRQENRPFRVGYRLSTVMVVYRLLLAVLQATPLNPLLAEFGRTVSMAGSLMTWGVYFALWRGLKGVFDKAGQPPQTGSAGALVFWYTLLIPLSLIGAQGLLAILFLILWIIILTRLFRVSRCLDDAGHAVKPAPVRLSSGRAAALWLGVPAAAIMICLLLFQRFPVSGAPTGDAPKGLPEIRAELLELGFPSEVLADLPDDEVALLEGALYVDGSSSEGGGGRDLAGLSADLVMVVLPDDTLRFYGWFHWDEPPKHRLMDSIEFIPNWQNELVSIPGSSSYGQLIWEDGGRTFNMPLESDWAHSTVFSSLFGNSSYSAFYYDFSLPKDGENIRGYVTWQARPSRPGLWLNFNVLLNYTHQSSIFNYPWYTPNQYQLQTGDNTDLIFPREQHLVLFQYPGWENLP